MPNIPQLSAGDYVRVLHPHQGKASLDKRWRNAIVRVEALEADGRLRCAMHKPNGPEIAHFEQSDVALVLKYQSLFQRGKRFQVVCEGASIRGMKPSGPFAQSGVRIDVPAGTVLTCLGYNDTFGDGVSAIMWADKDGRWICNDAIFSPHSPGMWFGHHPVPGSVEPLDLELPE